MRAMFMMSVLPRKHQITASASILLSVSESFLSATYQADLSNGILHV